MNKEVVESVAATSSTVSSSDVVKMPVISSVSSGVAVTGNSDGIASSTSGPVPGDEGTDGRNKRRKSRMAGCPKMPITGYVRYMNERREELRRDQPPKSAIEQTKIIGEEWQAMSKERKAPYLKAAQLDKERYLGELHIFLYSHPDVLAQQWARKRIARQNAKANANANGVSSTGGMGAGKRNLNPRRRTRTIIRRRRTRIGRRMNLTSVRRRFPMPLYERQPKSMTRYGYATPSVNRNLSVYIRGRSKVQEEELRKIRQKNLELAKKAETLKKRVESLRHGVEKLKTHNDEMEAEKNQRAARLNDTKHKLALLLADVPIPTMPNGATAENIDSYLREVFKTCNEAKARKIEGPAWMIKARDIIIKHRTQNRS